MKHAAHFKLGTEARAYSCFSIEFLRGVCAKRVIARQSIAKNVAFESEQAALLLFFFASSFYTQELKIIYDFNVENMLKSAFCR